ncbi:hypothetical protein ACJJTC_000207 [Scirpophaga incertulas]
MSTLHIIIPYSAVFKKLDPRLMQCVLAHRKPRWLPVAKSKIYRIPKRPVVPEDERRELMRLNNNYNTYMRAIKQFYRDEMVKEQTTSNSATSEMSLKLDAEEWARCEELNGKWNAQVSLEREERRKIQLAEMEEYALARMEAKDKQLREKIEKASEEIRIQKELSATFITPEKLDQAIEHALANPVDYNFAIDLQGGRYEGRDSPPVLPKNKDEILQ